jgi:hypothetical protein
VKLRIWGIGRSLLAALPLGLLVSQYGYTQNAGPRLDIASVYALEAALRLPHGARRLSSYVRYYYSSASSSNQPIINGVFIDKGWFQNEPIPSNGIVIVNGPAEVPDIEDGGCSVVYVEFNRSRSGIPSATCSAEVITKG